MIHPNLKPNVSVVSATHVEIKGGGIHRIASTWGISQEGRLAKPSEGGFGVITEDGQRVDMYHATRYFQEEAASLDNRDAK